MSLQFIGRETALPCPLYHSGAAGIDISYAFLIRHLLKGKNTISPIVLGDSKFVVRTKVLRN